MEPVLVNASIVALMSHPSPGTFTVQFLKKNGLFQDRSMLNQVVVPMLTQYAYEGDLFFEAVEARVKVELHKNATPAGEPPTTDTEHLESLKDVAHPLFEAIDYMAPNAVGLNFQFALGEGGTLQALIPNLSDAYQLRQAVLRRETANHQFNFNFGINEQVTPSQLMLEANVHIPLAPGPNNQILDAIGTMPDMLREVRSELAAIAL